MKNKLITFLCLMVILISNLITPVVAVAEVMSDSEISQLKDNSKTSTEESQSPNSEIEKDLEAEKVSTDSSQVTEDSNVDVPSSNLEVKKNQV